jgi:hypothetical protein
MIDEELNMKFVSCIHISAVHPLKFVEQADQTIAIYVQRRLLAQIEMRVLAHMTPKEILKHIGVPINDRAGKD